MWEQAIQQLIPTLGFSAVFLYMLNKLWEHHKRSLDIKNDDLRKINERVLTAFEENSKVIQKNTTLTELILDEIRGNKKNADA